MTTDEQAITKIVSDLEADWNAGDGVGFASHFADDAVFIHIYGGQLDGRVAIEAAHRQILNGIYKSSRNQYTPMGIRFLRPDVAVVLLHAHLQFYERGESREIFARPALIATREHGTWQLAAFQNTRISEMPGDGKAPTGTVN